MANLTGVTVSGLAGLIYTQEKPVIFYMPKLLLYEAGTKISRFLDFF